MGGRLEGDPGKKVAISVEVWSGGAVVGGSEEGLCLCGASMWAGSAGSSQKRNDAIRRDPWGVLPTFGELGMAIRNGSEFLSCSGSPSPESVSVRLQMTVTTSTTHCCTIGVHHSTLPLLAGFKTVVGWFNPPRVGSIPSALRFGSSVPKRCLSAAPLPRLPPGLCGDQSPIRVPERRFPGRISRGLVFGTRTRRRRQPRHDSAGPRRRTRRPIHPQRPRGTPKVDERSGSISPLFPAIEAYPFILTQFLAEKPIADRSDFLRHRFAQRDFARHGRRRTISRLNDALRAPARVRAQRPTLRIFLRPLGIGDGKPLQRPQKKREVGRSRHGVADVFRPSHVRGATASHRKLGFYRDVTSPPRSRQCEARTCSFKRAEAAQQPAECDDLASTTAATAVCHSAVVHGYVEHAVLQILRNEVHESMGEPSH
jgi:hypothetical protein